MVPWWQVVEQAWSGGSCLRVVERGRRGRRRGAADLDALGARAPLATLPRSPSLLHLPPASLCSRGCASLSRHDSLLLSHAATRGSPSSLQRSPSLSSWWHPLAPFPHALQPAGTYSALAQTCSSPLAASSAAPVAESSPPRRFLHGLLNSSRPLCGVRTRQVRRFLLSSTSCRRARCPRASTPSPDVVRCSDTRAASLQLSGRSRCAAEAHGLASSRYVSTPSCALSTCAHIGRSGTKMECRAS